MTKIWSFAYEAHFRAGELVTTESGAVGAATEGEALAAIGRDRNDGRTLIKVTKLTQIDPDKFAYLD
ncbi:hypothetical protein KUF83_30625 [Streptomyces sp. BV286]|uniref:hypothetical protein n=1 Tax=Streptomyces sp. BV286 TaxID=2849672 RepID=UPI001C2E0665|nr:hypothetical protein [Streptomyces sp. BV286]MBV1940890.1 hypothetical protein [Streptomyces sp. BV286]